MVTRVRSKSDDARRMILEAASRLLAAGGPAAVQVRAIAAEIGVSDAAVNHYFGTREQLLESLLRFGGAKLKTDLHTVLETWTDACARPLPDRGRWGRLRRSDGRGRPVRPGVRGWPGSCLRWRVLDPASPPAEPPKLRGPAAGSGDQRGWSAGSAVVRLRPVTSRASASGRPTPSCPG